MHFEVYKDRLGDWRWRLIDADDRNVADSATTFPDVDVCMASVMVVQKLAPLAEVLVDAGDFNDASE